jgi:hypothetical protein
VLVGGLVRALWWESFGRSPGRSLGGGLLDGGLGGDLDLGRGLGGRASLGALLVGEPWWVGALEGALVRGPWCLVGGGLVGGPWWTP